MSQIIQNGTIWNDVVFIDKEEDAKMTVLWDEKQYSEQSGAWFYFYRGYLVAIKK